ncbi:MAG TPA: alpha/beta hydrolase [Bacteroidia bacterium]|jgi:3-oxoadipate enol-lactonase|nr:alpha/beta hydrolase [Bacteroidia bacterium]
MICKTHDSLNLYYEIQGNLSAKKTIVFLNGLSQSTIAWILTTPHFKDNYRIVLMDFIFQGQSDKSGEWRDFDQHAKDVLGLLNEIKADKVILAGLSYGSLVAQHFAVLFPERLEKLILISTFAHKTPYYNAIELAWWRALELGGYPLMLDIMLPAVLSEEYFKNPLIPIDLMKQARQETNGEKEALFKLMEATKRRPDYRNELQKIKTPTLIIQGEKDLLLPVHMAAEVNKNISGSQFRIILGAGHTLNLEAIPQMSAEIKIFIEK